MSYGEIGPGPLEFESRAQPLTLTQLDEAERVFNRFFIKVDVDANNIVDQKLFFTNGDIIIFAQDVLERTELLASMLCYDEGSMVSKASAMNALLFGYHVGKTVFSKVGSIQTTLRAEQPFNRINDLSQAESFDILSACGEEGMNLLGQDSGIVRDIVHRHTWGTSEKQAIAETAAGLGISVFHTADEGRLRRESEKTRFNMEAQLDYMDQIDWDAELRELT